MDAEQEIREALQDMRNSRLFHHGKSKQTSQHRHTEL